MFPELWMEVFVAPEDERERALIYEMLARAHCQVVDTPEEADLVIFGGGADVDPALYGATKHRRTHFDSSRDKKDIELYNLCYELGIPMFGICRGAQFLHVMNGGKLYQDVDGHVGDHSIWDLRLKQQIARVSSVHHQLVMDNTEGGMEIVADASRATQRHIDDSTVEDKKGLDIEAFFYRESCSFGVQGHPEYRGYAQFLRWTLTNLEHYILHNPDLELRNNVRRMKEDIIGQRAQIALEKAAENLKEKV